MTTPGWVLAGQPGVVATYGLPASGKSTWAGGVRSLHPERVVCVSKDEIRAMLYGGVWEPSFEPLVERIRDAAVTHGLSELKLVICHDTNLEQRQIDRLKHLAEHHSVPFHIERFPIDVDECIHRDAGRGMKSVGEEVIRKMHAQYLA